MSPLAALCATRIAPAVVLATALLPAVLQAAEQTDAAAASAWRCEDMVEQGVTIRSCRSAPLHTDATSAVNTNTDDTPAEDKSATIANQAAADTDPQSNLKANQSTNQNGHQHQHGERSGTRIQRYKTHRRGKSQQQLGL